MGRRGQLAARLAEVIRVHADTSAARHEQWFAAYEHQSALGLNITTVRSNADHAVYALDAEILRLRGEIDALRVEIDQVDYETHAFGVEVQFP